MKTFKAAVAQFAVNDGDKAANLSKAGMLVARAARQGADLVVLPEYLMTGWVPRRFARLAEPVPGEFTWALGRIAAEHGVHLAASVLERARSGLHNTAVLLGPGGDLLGSQRKLHMYRDEHSLIKCGKEIGIVKTRFGKAGLLICYDAVFPEMARRQALLGAEFFLVASNWPSPHAHPWRVATSARALENQAWVVATNRTGREGRWSYFGASRIVGPSGRAVVECGAGEAVRTASIDQRASERFKRLSKDFLADRLPSAYAL
jgi:predicted amidohydrolase